MTVSGAEGESGAPIHIQVVGREAVTTAEFVASNPGIPIQHGNWAEFPSYTYFLETGCFETTATCEGGNWTIQVPFEAPEEPLSAAAPSLTS